MFSKATKAQPNVKPSTYKMKQLLGWMRHKFRENSKEPLKDGTPGLNCFCLPAQPSLDDHDTYTKSCYGSRYNSRFKRQPNQPCGSSFSGFKPRDAEGNFEDDTSMDTSELFHGFLTIGTLGLEPTCDEPATPTFGIAPENPTDDKIVVTENDLKLINAELEKFLEAEAEGASHQSSGRSSHIYTITTSSNPTESKKTDENEKAVIFPLQWYLFGSSIELPEAKMEVKKEKASLGELFQRTKMQDENSKAKCGNKEMETNQTHRSAKQLVKKILKKLHASSKSSTPSGKTDSASTKEKLQKVIQILHRKIHPEISVAERELNKSCGLQINNTLSNASYIRGDQIHPDNTCNKCPLGLKSKEEIFTHEMDKKPTAYELRGSGPAGNREHWIKTDADYLVLEL